MQYTVKLTTTGYRVYDSIVEKIDKGHYDHEEDIQIFSPLGLVLGEMGASIYTDKPTKPALVEALKIQMEVEFDAGSEFTGEQLKMEWFKFCRRQKLIVEVGRLDIADEDRDEIEDAVERGIDKQGLVVTNKYWEVR